MARKNRTKLLTLDETTWELAIKKTNFSSWVRDQLRSERNRGNQSILIKSLEMEIKQLEEDKEYWFQRCIAYIDLAAGEEE